MKTMENFVEQLTGPGLADALVEQMLEHVEGFREGRKGYEAAIRQLKAAQVDAAIQKRFTAVLLFSGYLGFQMNLDHFRNAMAPNCTWQQLDYNDYLREDLAYRLPEYREADQVLQDFAGSLTEEQEPLYETIMDYESYLATFGPKLAHYYGYLLGDKLLPHLIPGYHPDASLTYKYNLMLANYFGKAFLPVAI